MRIGLFGGSFNPPHIGHGIAVYYLLESSPLEEIWLIPTHRHAFDKQLVGFDARVEMCSLLAKPFGGRVRVCTIEGERDEVSYTIDTVRELSRRYPDHHFEWIVGSDILRETAQWKEFDTLTALIPFRILSRPGFEGGSGVDMPAISSSEIRRRLARGDSLEGLVPTRVLEYIQHKGLYL